MKRPAYCDKANGTCSLAGELQAALHAIEHFQSNEQNLNQILESIHIAAFAIDCKHRIIFCNRAYEQLTGHKKKVVLNTRKQWSPFYASQRPTLADLVVDKTPREKIGRYYGEASRRISFSEDTYAMEIFFPNLGSVGRWIFCTASPLMDMTGAVIGAVETLQDLTQYKKVEDALFKSEEKSRTILEQIEDGYYEIDIEGRLTFFNDALTRIFGYPKIELIGMSYKEFTGPEYRERTFRAYNQVFLTGKPLKSFEWGIIRKDGTTRIIQLSASLIRDPSNNPIGFRGIVRDVTDIRKAQEELLRYHNHLEDLVQERTSELKEANRMLKKEIDDRKRAEKNLLREKNLLEDISRSLPCIFYMIDETGRFIKWNKTTEAMGGYTAEEMKSVRALDFFPIREKEIIAGKIHEVFSKGKAFVNTTVRRKDGREIPHYFTGVRTSIGQQKYQVGVGIDTSDAVRAEKALRESEEKLSAILSAVTDYMIIIDQNYSVVWANDKALSLFPDLIGDACHHALHGSLSPCDPCIGKQCFLKGGNFEREGHFIIPGNGKRMDFWSTTSIVTRLDNSAPELILELFRDITEKKAYEAETVRVGQLASIGELAAGVAHEINNPINGILNYVQILLEKPHGLPPDHDILQKVMKEGERVARIVHDLLSFARVRNDEYVSISFDDIISSCLGLVGRQLSSDGISLSLKKGERLPELYCNSQQLQQVFLNIISNSRYALNHKYKKSHKNKKIEIEAEESRLNGGKALRITVCDHGTGIPAELLDKIGSPFFTTKPVNEGTGLGLSISHGIIKNHGGRLRFDSRWGKYTKVIIDLPVITMGERHA